MFGKKRSHKPWWLPGGDSMTFGRPPIKEEDRYQNPKEALEAMVKQREEEESDKK